MEHNNSIEKQKMKKYCLYKSENESSYSLFEENDLQNMKLLESDAELILTIEAESLEIACMKKHEFLGFEPYKLFIGDEKDLNNYLPKNKHDIENAQLLINLGYPQVKPVLPELFEWIQDINWPVAQVIAPFLASIGEPIIPYITHVLRRGDSIWKYWTLTQVINEMKNEELLPLKNELLDLVNTTNSNDIAEGVNLEAKNILTKKLGVVL